MHRRAGELHTVGQGFFVDMESVIPFPAKRGNQRRVDIHNGIGVGIHQFLGKNNHTPCQHNQIDLQFFQHGNQRHSHRLVGRILFSGQYEASDIGPLGPFQCIGACFGRDHRNNLAPAQFSPMLGINQCLQIGAATGNQHGNSLFGHSTHLSKQHEPPVSTYGTGSSF